ncbi:predicted protein [Botrytis cinerea T4]|uniref:Uncharacterized protein n=1 Tax=Botryotinia fuckeliana (strain T4) TaxID=999810 RepID=G2Y814_BOTF4|nr:predicted protein [Botrytis cinerea T4]
MNASMYTQKQELPLGLGLNPRNEKGKSRNFNLLWLSKRGRATAVIYRVSSFSSDEGLAIFWTSG